MPEERRWTYLSDKKTLIPKQKGRVLTRGSTLIFNKMIDFMTL